MSLKIISGDICKINAEVIVNSLNIDARKMDVESKNIVLAADCDEVYELINTKINNEPLDMFITNSGNLSHKIIIHIVTPSKENDDNKSSNLVKAYKKVIDEAINRGYKSIVVPYLGQYTGYSISDIYSVIIKASDGHTLDDDKEDKFKIMVVFPKIEELIYEHDELSYPEVVDYSDQSGILSSRIVSTTTKKTEPKVKKEVSKRKAVDIDQSININSVFGLVSEKEMFRWSGVVENAAQFIDAYLYENKIKPGKLHGSGIVGIDKDTLSKCRNNNRKFKKEAILRAGVVLGWNRTVFLQALSIGGFSFNVTNNIEILFAEYLKKNELCKGLNEFLDKHSEMTHIMFDSNLE